MYKYILLLFVLFSFIWAQNLALEKYDDNRNKIFELFADNIETENYKITVATGNAVIINENIYIIADYIKYNTETKEAEIKGNVKIYRDSSLFLQTNRALIKFDDSYYLIEPFYVQDSVSGMWISASLSEGTNKEYNLKNIVVSGCNIESPIWKIKGTSGYYNQDKSFASIWNPTIYIKNIPVLYLPYMFFSTKSKRTSGFLYPEFSNSSIEGFTYMQPIFLAVQDFWDMTFTPQARFKRGFGINAQARMVDFYEKLFELNTGIFYNYNQYVKKYNVSKQIIFGFDFNHKRANLLDKYLALDSDGLYLDFRYMNDLDYIRLQSTKNTTIENKIQTSRANYFASKDEHFFGLSFKYFLDLSQINNNETFQTLPQFQYHKYLEQTPIKNIMYAVDVKSKNIMRQKGFGYFDNSLTLPLFFHAPLLSGYLVLGASVDINAGIVTLNKIKNINSRIDDNNSTYFSANYGVYMNSDIAKQYDSILHTMSFESSLTGPFYRYYRDDNNVFTPALSSIEEIKDSFGTVNIVSKTREQLKLKFSQYFFGLESIELLYHRMYQDINLYDLKEPFGNLGNEFGFAPISNIDVSTTLFYSHYRRQIDEASLSLTTYIGDFTGNVTYFFKKKFDLLDSIKNTENSANFIRIKMNYDFGYFNLYGNIGYDFKEKYLRDWNLLISKDIRCFGIGLRFASEILPILTSDGSRTIRNSFVSLELRFVPITSTSMTYRINNF